MIQFESAGLLEKASQLATLSVEIEAYRNIATHRIIVIVIILCIIYNDDFLAVGQVYLINCFPNFFTTIECSELLLRNHRGIQIAGSNAAHLHKARQSHNPSPV